MTPQSDDRSDGWYFDLRLGIAVPASERGPGDHLLGPYATKGQAENWKATNDARNEAWDEDDDRWNQRDDGNDERIT
jgi:hypothetical protein